MYLVELMELTVSEGVTQLVEFRFRFCWSVKFVKEDGHKTSTALPLVRVRDNAGAVPPANNKSAFAR